MRTGDESTWIFYDFRCIRRYKIGFEGWRSGEVCIPLPASSEPQRIAHRKTPTPPPPTPIMSTTSSATVPAEHLCPFKSCCFLCVCGFVLLVQPHQPLLSEHLHPHTYSMKCSYIHYYLPHLPVCIILRPTNQPTCCASSPACLPAYLCQISGGSCIIHKVTFAPSYSTYSSVQVGGASSGSSCNKRGYAVKSAAGERDGEGPKAHTGKFTIS